MSMVVRTNVMAMNSNRALGVNNSTLSKSIEKLSSGFRINRAADDASGLAISEKMKSQIKGLEQASTNSQDGISLIQTAEGATTEIHNMLNRMKELAIKSANGTIQDDVDREAIQEEITALNEEITRIAESTTFNGIQLLDGTMSGFDGEMQLTAGTTGAAAASQSYVLSFTNIDFEKLQAGDTTIHVSGQAIEISLTDTEVDAATSADLAANLLRTKVIAELGGDSKIADSFGGNYTAAAGTTTGSITLTASKVGVTTIEGELSVNKEAVEMDGDLSLQVGDTADAFNKVDVSVGDLSAEGLRTNVVNLGNQEDAAHSVSIIENAINVVSTSRANLGAIQNRLEYTINNLDVTAENMSAANSRIRDTDMATEMMAYTQANVLTQAAQAMLAQANQQPQAVLQLLQ